jgi:hypothetical protein
MSVLLAMDECRKYGYPAGAGPQAMKRLINATKLFLQAHG